MENRGGADEGFQIPQIQYGQQMPASLGWQSSRPLSRSSGAVVRFGPALLGPAAVVAAVVPEPALPRMCLNF